MSNKEKNSKTGNNERKFMLPRTLTTVYQSNRLTSGAFQGFGLIHTRIFFAIIRSLQDAIRAEMNGLDWQQMNLFEEAFKDSIKIKLYLKDITTANHYPDAIKAAKELMGLIIKLKKSNLPKEYISFRALFSGVDEPIKLNGRTFLTIYILKDVAKEIISLDKNRDGAAINYTKYVYETAMLSKSKYTQRIYVLISSWKAKGGFYITLEELRRILDIEGNEYDNFAAFKRKVLLPAQRELQSMGDCWFNAAESGFENRAGKKVTGLNFKVITKVSEEGHQQKVSHLYQMLILHGGFKEKDIHNLKPVFKQAPNINDIIVKAVYFMAKKEDESGKPIENKVAYVTNALIKYFVKIKK